MRLRVRRLHEATPGQDQVAVCDINDALAPASALLHALGLSPESNVSIDGKQISPQQTLQSCGLVDGVTLTVRARDPGIAGHDANLGNPKSWIVETRHGPDAGKRLPVAASDRLCIGRTVSSSDADYQVMTIDDDTVSEHHCTLAVGTKANDSVIVRDHQSRNGVRIGADGRPRHAIECDKDVDFAQHEVATGLQLGATRLGVLADPVSDRPIGTTPEHADATGHLLFNRPPRTPVETSLPLVPVPPAIADRVSPTISFLAFFLPIAFALAMVVILGSWRYALFGLMSPVMLLGNFVTSRRRVKRERTGDLSASSDALERFQTALREAEIAERRRRYEWAPDLAEVHRRAKLPSRRLWERRNGDLDATTLLIGRGETSWLASVAEPSVDTDPRALAIASANNTLHDVELLADVADGPIGIVGTREARQRLARSMIVQLAVHRGPADLSIAIFGTLRDPSWRWTSWLPHHVSDGAFGVDVVLAGDGATRFAESVLESRDENPSDGLLAVVDDVGLLHRRASSVRSLVEQIEQQVFAIVLADSVDQLPACTATVIELDEAGREFTSWRTATPELRSTGVADGVAVDVAEQIAQALARFADPDQRLRGGGLPDSVTPNHVGLGDLLSSGAGLKIRRRWASNTSGTTLTFPIGMSGEGVVELDLVGDGPHALVAGTTGAGKSELLRTLVVGLAANHHPDQLVFVLVDYKGGSAFDACAALPHVVGMVTDLDEHLAERALLSLEAELHFRETELRSHGVSDLASLIRAGGSLPRLVVVIDEFATLRAELPEFMSALIGIAQRGRSLGVHVVLATQRPSGAVDANIRANTNLRIALRVQDAGDSRDVIDSPDAAHLSRAQPGRAIIRRGSGDLRHVQTAYVSGSERPLDPPSIQIRGVASEAPERADGRELQAMVDALSRAFDGPAPRRPWLPDLPTAIHRRELAPVSIDGIGIGIGIVDRPAHQSQVVSSWNPTDGHFGVSGALGAGVTTTLQTLCEGLIENEVQRWIYVVDTTGADWAPFAKSPLIGAVISGHETARIERLLYFLSTELERRRSVETVEQVPIVCLIDGVAPFLDGLYETGGDELVATWERLARDGAAVGISIAAGAGRPQDFGRRLQPYLRKQIVLELAEPSGYASVGIPTSSLPTFCPGRGLTIPDGEVIQLFTTNLERLETCRSQLPHESDAPSIEALPTDLALSALPGSASPEVAGHALALRFGLDDAARDAATLHLRAGEHAFVSGPSNSGKTTVLLSLARQARAIDADTVIVGIEGVVGSMGSLDGAGSSRVMCFDALGPLADLEAVLRSARDDERRWLILVDDAERIEIDDGPLWDLVRSPRPQVFVVASSHHTRARQAYGHWTRFVRSSGIGVLLQPDLVHDGDLLGVRLPRKLSLPDVPGRGVLSSSAGLRVVQVAY